MLAGLLCDLLGANRWESFHRFLAAESPCAGRYDLTGDAAVDDRRSVVLDRAWRGDGGGALALAAGGHAYDDPLELLADTRSALDQSAETVECSDRVDASADRVSCRVRDPADAPRRWSA
jgi:hypothetical protein